MKSLQPLVEACRRSLGGHWSLPEHRPIELYTRRKQLAFEDGAPEPGPALPDLLGARVALTLLEGFLDSADAALFEGKTSWEKCLALPRHNTTQRLVAEVFRILRVLRIVTTHQLGRIEIREGLIHATGKFHRDILTLTISEAGLALVESFVFCYLDSFHQPYGETYVEALLTQYYADIIGEVHTFTDENRSLYQFRVKFPYFNRHFRLDCANPHVRIGTEQIEFDLGEHHLDPARTPIDFFLSLDEALYIIPAEALTGNRLALEALPAWRARTPGRELPARFRLRFGRRSISTTIPMT